MDVELHIENTERGAAQALLRLPSNLQDGLRMYVEHGIEPGGFLCSVIENDLEQAIAYADPGSLLALPDVVRWLHNYVSGGIWRSRENRLAWQRAKSAERRKAG